MKCDSYTVRNEGKMIIVLSVSSIIIRGVAKILGRGFLISRGEIFRSHAHNYEKRVVALAQMPRMTVVEH